MIYLFGMTRIVAVLLGLAVSGCATTPAPAAAQDGPREPLRTLDVSADATVRRAPDMAAIRLAVETHAPTAREASRGNASAMSAVIDRLRELGIPDRAVQTQSIDLSPRYRRGPGVEEPTIEGYQAVNRVAVRIDDIADVGRVVDAAIDAGANRVEGISFELSDPESAYHEAVEQAMAKARREAEVMAAALDETLGPAIRVSTGGVRTPIPQMAGFARAEAAATPVQPGELEVRATVHITYRLGT